MKRKLCLLVAALMCGVLAQASIAPLAGYYVSQELSGVPNDGIVLDGRWSEASPTGAEGAVGSTIHAASWDGASLGTMWEVIDPAIQSVTLISDIDLGGGLTQKVYQTTYTGGTLTLKDAGPWWNAADSGSYSEYVLTIDSYSHVTTKEYLNGTQIGFTTSVALNATFVEDPSMTVSFLIAAAVPIGMGATVAPDYPDFAINAPGGAWGNVQKIRMEIVPEPATLVILGLGGLTLLRKRK